MELYDFFNGKGYSDENYENQINNILFRFLLTHEYETPHLLTPLTEITVTDLELCGSGSFGIVYKKENKCIKQIDKQNLKNGFLECKLLDTEIDILKQLKENKYTISFIELLQSNKAYYIITDYGGKSLSKMLSENNELEFHKKLNIIKQISEAVSYIHAEKIAHCDLNPSNILINSAGIIKLCDFGFSVNIDNTKDVAVCGTIGYYSPQMHNTSCNLDIFKNDSWSVGVTFLYILSITNILFKEWIDMYKQTKISFSNVNHILSDFTRELILYHMHDGIEQIVLLMKCIIHLLRYDQQERHYIYDINRKHIKNMQIYDYTVRMVNRNDVLIYISELIYTYLIPKKTNKINPAILW